MTASKAKLAWWSGEQFWGCTFDQVSRPGAWGFGRCTNKAKHDPDADGNPTRCGIHCAAAEERRRAKSDAAHQKHKADWNRKAALLNLNEEARIILKQIANGHNDPRGIASDWIKRREGIDQ